MNTVNTAFAATLVVIASLIGNPVAKAEGTRAVDLHHIDPTTPAGALRTYELIRRAANEACGVRRIDKVSVMEKLAAEDAQRCAAAAIADAVQRVNAVAGVDIEQLAGVRRQDLSGLANLSRAER